MAAVSCECFYCQHHHQQAGGWEAVDGDEEFGAVPTCVSDIQGMALGSRGPGF